MALSDVARWSDYPITDGTVIAEESFESERGVARGPERALMSALLFDGVIACINYSGAMSKAGRNRFREALTWVSTPGDDYVFSFENVCQCLGIDPNALRMGLTNILNTHAAPLKKSRRTC